MALPKIHSPHQTVDIGGELFDIRVFTRAEAFRFQQMQEAGVGKDELEMAVIAAATDTPEDDTRAWYGVTDSWVVEELIGHIQRVSRLTEGAQKSGGTGDSAGG
jgi:hypothetical protein